MSSLPSVLKNQFVALGYAALLLVACQPVAPDAGLGTKRDGGTAGTKKETKDGEQCSVRQACCTDSKCDPGLQCNAKTNTCCVASTNKCDAAKDCCAGNSCTDGKCCGSSGVACNNPNDCCKGLTCDKGQCTKAGSGGCSGAANTACCTGQDSKCASGLVCVTNMCKTCGPAGQPCCDNNVCSDGATCNTTTKKCETTCGDDGDPCCKGAKPCDKSPGLSCDMASGKCSSNPGSTTGGVGQACKSDGTCNGILVCLSNKKCSKPSTNSTEGATCTNNTCSNGFVCDTATNKCSTAATMKKPLQGLCSNVTQCQQGLECEITRQPDKTEEKSCCVGASKACEGDYDCCGLLLCGEDGACVAGEVNEECLSAADCDSRFCGPDKFCASGSNAPECLGFKSLFSSCTSEGECCAGTSCLPVGGSPLAKNCCYLGGHACEPDALFSTSIGNQACCGHMICSQNLSVCVCRQAGESCFTPDECCDDGAQCMAGKCFVPGETPVSPGGLCTDDLQCIDANDSTYFCAKDLGSGTKACCTEDAQSKCRSSTECCGSLICDDNGFFNLNISKVCCAPQGGPCLVSDDCCGHGSCGSDNTCK